jgi:hypothetical protein
MVSPVLRGRAAAKEISGDPVSYLVASGQGLTVEMTCGIGHNQNSKLR